MYSSVGDERNVGIHALLQASRWTGGSVAHISGSSPALGESRRGRRIRGRVHAPGRQHPPEREPNKRSAMAVRSVVALASG
jgi:hypothetical protein